MRSDTDAPRELLAKIPVLNRVPPLNDADVCCGTRNFQPEPPVLPAHFSAEI